MLKLKISKSASVVLTAKEEYADFVPRNRKIRSEKSGKNREFED